MPEIVHLASLVWRAHPSGTEAHIKQVINERFQIPLFLVLRTPDIRIECYTALPWAGKGDRENQIHLDEVHDLLIALVSKFLNLNQGSGSFGMHCIL